MTKSSVADNKSLIFFMDIILINIVTDVKTCSGFIDLFTCFFYREKTLSRYCFLYRYKYKHKIYGYKRSTNSFSAVNLNRI